MAGETEGEVGWERRLYPPSRPFVISHVGTHSHVYGEGGRCQGSGIVSVSRLGIWLAGVRIHVDLRFIHVPDSWEVLLPLTGPPDSLYTFHLSIKITFQTSFQGRVG